MKRYTYNRPGQPVRTVTLVKWIDGVTSIDPEYTIVDGNKLSVFSKAKIQHHQYALVMYPGALGRAVQQVVKAKYLEVQDG